MEIKAVKFRRDGFYTQPFVFGGKEGKEKFDKNVRYRGSLQNYLIDTCVRDLVPGISNSIYYIVGDILLNSLKVFNKSLAI